MTTLTSNVTAVGQQAPQLHPQTEITKSLTDLGKRHAELSSRIEVLTQKMTFLVDDMLGPLPDSVDAGQDTCCSPGRLAAVHGAVDVLANCISDLECQFGRLESS